MRKNLHAVRNRPLAFCQVKPESDSKSSARLTTRV